MVTTKKRALLPTWMRKYFGIVGGVSAPEARSWDLLCTKKSAPTLDVYVVVAVSAPLRSVLGACGTLSGVYHARVVVVSDICCALSGTGLCTLVSDVLICLYFARLIALSVL